MGALALTSKAAYREPFEPLPGDVTFVPYGDERGARRRPSTDRTAAVLLEPIQGEAGVEVPPEGYLAAARRDRRRARRAALARRGADRASAAPGVVRAPRRAGVRPGRRDRGQGSGRRLPDRRLHRPRRGRRPAPAGQPRHHLRRQPGRVRRRARGDRHHRGRGAARARHGARPEAARRPGRRPAGHRGPRRGPADRPRPGRGQVRRGGRRPRWRPASSSTTRHPHRVRLAPPLVLTEADASGVWPRRPGRPSSTEAGLS